MEQRLDIIMVDNILHQQEQLLKLIDYFRIVLFMNHVDPDSLENLNNVPPANMDIVGVMQAKKLLPMFKRDINMLDGFIVNLMKKRGKKMKLTSEIQLPSLQPMAVFESVSILVSNGGVALEPGPVTGDEIIHVGLLDAYNCENVKALHDELYKVHEHDVICVFREYKSGEYVICEVSTDKDNLTDFKFINL